MDSDNIEEIFLVKNFRGELKCHHYGQMSRYDKLSGTHFKRGDSIATINSIKYTPDKTYNKHDGYWGKCWIAKITFDDGETKYYWFREFVSLVLLFEKSGYKFVKPDN